jgi:Fic family protein
MLPVRENLISGSLTSNKPQVSFGSRRSLVGQISAVLFAKETGKITNVNYQKLTDVSAATAQRDLKDLVDRDIFVMKGVRKESFASPRQ